VRNERLDILSANQLGYALFSEGYADPARPVNHARFVFLNPRAAEFYVDWDGVADDAAGILRAAAGRDPTTADSRSRTVSQHRYQRGGQESWSTPVSATRA
jgi:hypothetical protein